MTAGAPFRVAVFPGDGIGPEVVSPCLEILDAVADCVGGFGLEFENLEAGAALYSRTGEAFPEETFEKAKAADAVLLGAMGLPDVRYPDGTEISPQLDLRERLRLYAGVRPVKAIRGIPVPLADPRAMDIDFVIVRESTEGLFAARGKTESHKDSEARDTMVITRAVSERVFDFAFRLALQRKAIGGRGHVTCVDKANVLGAFAFFRKVYLERAARFADISADAAYVDATGFKLVAQPWDFDVLVTENMFGDILSDVGAALIGGMGMAPSADIGDDHAVFQPCHGTAPDIAGTGRANPTAMFLSASMMLDWLGRRQGMEPCIEAATLLAAAVRGAFVDGSRVPYEIGGNAGTAEIANAVLKSVTTGREKATVQHAEEP